MPEYYANDQLRWALGFDNPNKAGALLAALLPFAWWLCVNQLKNPVARVAGRLLGFTGVTAGVYVLLHTYSRGAIMAMGMAGLYLAWCYRASWRKWLLPVAGASVLLCAAVALVVLPHRSAAIASDSSVTNRFELWKGALQIFGSAPVGVGLGNSGAVYMDWFQPIERTEKYRTMVNSYLTFLVECGWLPSLLALFLLTYFWLATRDSTSHLARAARASLVATGAAGFVSTTLEDWRLWLPVISSAFILIGTNWASLSRAFRRRSIGSAVLCGVTISGCFLAGKWMAADTAIQIFKNDEVIVTPKGAGNDTMDLLPDPLVLSSDWPKLVRELASSLKRRIHVDGSHGATVIVTGERVADGGWLGRKVILLAPSKLSQEDLDLLLQSAAAVVLLNPSFDEDGRVRFWKRVAATEPSKVRMEILSGVGTDVAWSWSQVVEAIQKSELQVQGAD